MDFLRNLFGKKEPSPQTSASPVAKESVPQPPSSPAIKESAPVDPAKQRMATMLALTAGLEQQQDAVSQAASNEDYPAMIRACTKGIEFANKFPDLLPDFADRVIFLYTMRATGYWATDKNSLALADIEQALSLPIQKVANNPMVTQAGERLRLMKRQILAGNR